MDEDLNLENIIDVIENGQNVILHGPGGCGKTHFLRVIASTFVDRNKTVACTATTGIAAINLTIPGKKISGSTLHSWAGVGLAVDTARKLAAKVEHDDRAKKNWQSTDILIVDEVSMLAAEFIDKLDYIGRQVRREHEKPFGGLQIVFSGDFLQLPPVKAQWVFESIIWKEMIQDSLIFPFVLDIPKRYADLEWFEMLLRIRKAAHTVEDVKFLRSRVKAYDAWLKSSASRDIGSVKPTVLHSKNDDVNTENERELKKLPGEPIAFRAEDIPVHYNNYARTEHYKKALDEAIPEHILLKTGAQVMLKANLDVKRGLANGSRGVVMDIINTQSVKVKWLNGSITIVDRHTWIQEDKDGKVSRVQIPLILAWSMTIHRSQGCTLDYAIVDLGPSIFIEGQAYVALSRVRSSEGLFLVEFYPPVIKVNKAALEYVESIETDDRDHFESAVVEEIPKYELIFMDE